MALAAKIEAEQAAEQAVKVAEEARLVAERQAAEAVRCFYFYKNTYRIYNIITYISCYYI